MKQAKRLFYFIFLMMVVSGTSVMKTFTQNYPEEKLAIQKLYYDMSKALMDKGWERYQSYFVQDTTLNVVHPGEMDWATGWHAVKRRYKPFFGPEVNLQAELETDKFNVYIAPGGEFAWGLIDVKVIMEENTWHSWQVFVCQKIDGRWRINMAFDADLPSSNDK